MEIKFISYDGDFPNLCRGQLVLEIDGKLVYFGYKLNDILKDLSWFNKNKKVCNKTIKPLERFWSSGGCIRTGENWSMWAESGPWELDEDALPDELKPYGQKLIDIFNENVPWGCCGGCI